MFSALLSFMRIKIVFSFLANRNRVVRAALKVVHLLATQIASSSESEGGLGPGDSDLMVR
jgi:hypothetical protein